MLACRSQDRVDAYINAQIDHIESRSFKHHGDEVLADVMPLATTCFVPILPKD